MSTSAHHAPGVYSSEKDLSQYVLAVSTSIGALVGASGRGPVNKRTLTTSLPTFTNLFGPSDPSIGSLQATATEFLSQSSQLYVTRVINSDPAHGDLALTGGAFYSVDDPTASNPNPILSNFGTDGFDSTNANPSNTPKGIYDPFNTYTFNPNMPGIDHLLFFVCLENPGEWNNNMFIRVRPSTARGVTTVDTRYDDPLAFFIEVFENYVNTNSVPLESFLVKRNREVDGNGNQLYLEDVINNTSQLIRVRNNPYCSTTIPVTQTATVFIGGAINGAPPTFGQIMQGWDLYADTEQVEVNLLIQGGVPNGITSLIDIADIQHKMIDIAESRADCLALLDIPSSQQRYDLAAAYRLETLNRSSSYAAIYTADPLILDTDNNIKTYVPPSGYAAARCAYTDSVAAAWFAPAGMSRGTLDIRDVRFRYRQQERDYLYNNQVNTIRFFPDGNGYKIWGADTLQTQASLLSNVNVRRLLNFIERSLTIAMRYSVFEPDDPILWSFLTEIVKNFLKPIQQGRGLWSFDVVCDDRNNTSDVIATGDVMVDVYLVPITPAKRIHLNAIINKTGDNTFTANVAA